MLNDATCFKKIFIVTGYTDLRSGIDRLADTIRSYRKWQIASTLTKF